MKGRLSHSLFTHLIFIEWHCVQGWRSVVYQTVEVLPIFEELAA